ncbi:Cyanovirin-N domain protein [Gloeothece citriformis PCC 7424]|uniref:Cyanovirin-N domain protein n=1 Tax=Gloeothece citriformis (strain PCC 7424) TaxID=65393 RepID=B7KDN6_GLOC7|nr:CVNH domain-containing protein [Gloeothece citriformis]ACK70338.1 Cyanovirin-N domain protein [Gloeothece citriformis PCC 7424]
MKKAQLVLTFFFSFLLAVFVSFNLVVDSAMAFSGPVSESCIDLELSGSILSANCETANGYYEKASINLDEVIGNLDGMLSWDSQNFSQTCEDISLEKRYSITFPILMATCQEAIGGENYMATEVYLDDHIFNVNGTLFYN